MSLKQLTSLWLPMVTLVNFNRTLVILKFLFLVIYDDDITDGLIQTILRLFKQGKKLSELYIALEKRYVFVDSVCAPMYEYFLKHFEDASRGFLKFAEVPIDFPQYFEYDRCKELVLLRVQRL